MALHVGRWDCKHCGHIGVLGPYTLCTNCGATRPKDVVFYLPSDAEKVTKEEQKKEALAGADWVCSFCVTNNKAGHTNCQSCNNTRTDSDKVLQEREYEGLEVPRGGKPKNAEMEEVIKKVPFLRKLLKYLPFPAAFLGIFIYLGSFDTEITVTVDSMPWQRVIEMEQYIKVQEEEWSLPNGAESVEQFRAIHHHDQVSRGFETRTRDKQVQVGTEQYVCGKIDKGNGYFEDKYCERAIYETHTETYQEEIFDQVPVYKTKYRYQIYRWKPAESLKTSGTSKPAFWSEDARLNQPDLHREKRRKGEYFIVVKDHKDENQKQEASLRYWEKIDKGQELTALKSKIYGYYKKLKEDTGVN